MSLKGHNAMYYHIRLLRDAAVPERSRRRLLLCYPGRPTILGPYTQSFRVPSTHSSSFPRRWEIRQKIFQAVVESVLLSAWLGEILSLDAEGGGKREEGFRDRRGERRKREIHRDYGSWLRRRRRPRAKGGGHTKRRHAPTNRPTHHPPSLPHCHSAANLY